MILNIALFNIALPNIALPNIALSNIALFNIVLSNIFFLSSVLVLASLVTGLWFSSVVRLACVRIFRTLTTGTSVQVYTIIFAGPCFPVPGFLYRACTLYVVRTNQNSVFERAVNPLLSERFIKKLG